MPITDIVEPSDFAWSLFNESNDAILLIDPDSLRVIEVNPTTQRLTGIPRKSILGRDLASLFESGAEEIVDEICRSCRETRFLHAREGVELRCVVGSAIDVSVTASRLHAEAGVVAMVVARDVSERVAAHESAKRATAAKSQLLANVSHELRTPMTAILGFLDIVLDGGRVHDEDREHLVTVRRNADLLLELIEDLLDLSRADANRVELDIAEVAPGAVADDVQTLFETEARNRGLDFAVNVPHDVDVLVTDASRLRQILVNLVGNALKFTPSGRVTLDVRASAETPHVEFVVSDTGIGIAPENLAHVFEPFSQVDATDTRRFGGTGLGLSISKSLAERLGGTLVVASQPGQGSTFTLTLPSGDERPVSPPVSTTDDVAPTGPGGLSGRVLVADDASEIRVLVKYLLANTGLELTLVDSGTAAVDELSANGASFDLVLMDMQMPGMDGREACRRIREGGWQGPIVAMTAHSSHEFRDACLTAGFTDFLAKPMSRDGLLTAVARPLRDRCPTT